MPILLILEGLVFSHTTVAMGRGEARFFVAAIAAGELCASEKNDDGTNDQRHMTRPCLVACAFSSSNDEAPMCDWHRPLSERAATDASRPIARDKTSRQRRESPPWSSRAPPEFS
jgi:hypothetical protein